MILDMNLNTAIEADNGDADDEDHKSGNQILSRGWNRHRKGQTRSMSEQDYLIVQ